MAASVIQPIQDSRRYYLVDGSSKKQNCVTSRESTGELILPLSPTSREAISLYLSIATECDLVLLSVASVDHAS